MSILNKIFAKPKAILTPQRPRGAPRLMVSQPARLRAAHKDNYDAAMLDDVSATGACLRSHVHLRAGDQVELSINLGPGLRFDLLGRIVYAMQEAHGYLTRYGVRFLRMSFEDERRLAAYVAQEKFGRAYGAKPFSSGSSPA